MKKTSSQTHISAFAALVLFALFAACVLTVLLSGAGVYRRLAAGGEEEHARRTAVQYISTRVRRSGGEITIEPFGTGDALVLWETVDGEAYCTRIYCRDGWLMELFTHGENPMEPEDGERLIPLRAMELSLKDGLLVAQLAHTYGGESTLSFALRTGEEGVP